MKTIPKQMMGLVICAGALALSVAAQTNTFPSSGNVQIQANVTIGLPGSDYGAEFLPNVSGNSIFWIDDYNNALRFSNGNSPGNLPMAFTNTGYLGIGTASPAFILQLGASGNPAGSSNIPNYISIWGDAYGGNTPFAGLQFYNVDGNAANGRYTASILTNRDGDNYGGSLSFLTAESSANGGAPPATHMFINNVGNVGVGTTSPGAKLEVDGNIKLTASSGGSITFQDGTVQSTAYTGVTCGGDYAESVDVAGSRANYEPGDVLVIGAESGSDVAKSAEPYSTLVVGVYSTKPGVVGRRQTTDAKTSTSEVPMAMIGIVPTKVSAENGPIKRGDPLVTSSTPGYAMKGTDRDRMMGAVIGKSVGES